jgi:hypothetical protein
MNRFLLVLFVSLTCLSPATASLARKAPSEIKKNLPLEILKPFCSAVSNDEFRLTATTEVLLDGRPCRYNEVPPGATILLLELASNESKEIVKVHFQTSVIPKPMPASRQSSP